MRTGFTATNQRQLAIGLLVGLFAVGCERAAPVQTPSPSAKPASLATVVFPEELQAEDETVNAFVRQMIETCAAEDYDAFRLLWSARDKPLSEAEFIRGWRATRQVSILALQQRRDPRDGEIVYVVHGRVELDPDKVPQPEREIVLLLVKENGQWRIARAPSKVAKALKGELSEDENTNGADTNG